MILWSYIFCHVGRVVSHTSLEKIAAFITYIHSSYRTSGTVLLATVVPTLATDVGSHDKFSVGLRSGCPRKVMKHECDAVKKGVILSKLASFPFMGRNEQTLRCIVEIAVHQEGYTVESVITQHSVPWYGWR